MVVCSSYRLKLHCHLNAIIYRLIYYYRPAEPAAFLYSLGTPEISVMVVINFLSYLHFFLFFFAHPRIIIRAMDGG